MVLTHSLTHPLTHSPTHFLDNPRVPHRGEVRAAVERGGLRPLRGRQFRRNICLVVSTPQAVPEEKSNRYSMQSLIYTYLLTHSLTHSLTSCGQIEAEIPICFNKQKNPKR